MSAPRVGFAGDREIAVRVLDYLIAADATPAVLLLSAGQGASHAGELRARCEDLRETTILEGGDFRSKRGLGLLRAADLDFLICVHFPYYVPAEVLAIPRQGVLNLHPGYLPHTRGWHTPSWAILEQTPFGATLHVMSEEIDAGDIVAQRRLEIDPGDTAHSLYQRVWETELEVFRAAWPGLAGGAIPRTPQPMGVGTAHRKEELLSAEVQRIDLDAETTAGDLLRRLRALTTNRPEEAAYFEADGRKYRVRVDIQEEPQ